MKRLFLLILFGLAACSTGSGDTQPESASTCLGFTIQTEARSSCVVYTANRALVQSIDAETITLRGRTVSIVLTGTIMLENSEEQITVAVLEDRAIVGANGRTRTIQAGMQVTIAFNDNRAGFPSQTEPLQSRVDMPLERLPRAIPTLVFIAGETPVLSTTSAQTGFTGESTDQLDAEATSESTVEVTPEPVITDESGCVIPPGWNAWYIVERGDVLQLIAREHGVTVEQMVEANCLDDPGRLFAGQGLRIPGVPPTSIIPTQTGGIGFRADTVAIRRGECSLLRWDRVNTLEIYINDDLIENSDFLEVCPEETTVYILRATMSDGSEIERSISISVTP